MSCQHNRDSCDDTKRREDGFARADEPLGLAEREWTDRLQVDLGVALCARFNGQKHDEWSEYKVGEKPSEQCTEAGHQAELPNRGDVCLRKTEKTDGGGHAGEHGRHEVLVEGVMGTRLPVGPALNGSEVRDEDMHGIGNRDRDQYLGHDSGHIVDRVAHPATDAHRSAHRCDDDDDGSRSRLRV